MKKFMTITLALLLSLVMAAPALAFSDVKDNAAVDRISELGIMTGYPDGTFKPQDKISRAEFAKVAVLAAEHKLGDKIPMTLQENYFSDMVEGAWYTENINKAVNMGLMKGDAEGTFRPNDTVSEDEIITVLLRMLGYNLDNDSQKWPDNYWELAGNLNTDAFPEVVGKHDGSKATRGMAARYLNWALDIPTADDKTNKETATAGYGVVQGITDSRLTINGRAYLIKDYDFGKDKPEVGRLVRYEANKAGVLLAVSSEEVQTETSYEAFISGGEIKLNGKDYGFAKDAEIIVMNSAGGFKYASVSEVLKSNYVAGLRSAKYTVPIQYVLNGGKVEYLLISDYAGQSELHFGFIEEIAEGADGVIVQFFGDKTDYEWAPSKKDDQEPHKDTLYAYVLKNDGVRAYAVDVAAEQINNARVSRVSDICLAGGTQFIVAPDTVILEVEYREDGSLKSCEAADEVNEDDIVRVRYTEDKKSENTGIEAAYIIIDATNK